MAESFREFISIIEEIDPEAALYLTDQALKSELGDSNLNRDNIITNWQPHYNVDEIMSWSRQPQRGDYWGNIHNREMAAYRELREQRLQETVNAVANRAPRYAFRTAYRPIGIDQAIPVNPADEVRLEVPDIDFIDEDEDGEEEVMW